MVDETLAVAAQSQVFTKRYLGGNAFVGMIVEAFPVEPPDLAQHRPERQTEQVASLGEQGVQVAAFVFETGRPVMHRVAVLGRPEGHAQAVEQRREVRTGLVAEYRETHIDGVVAPIETDIHGVSLGANAVGRLEQGDVVLAVEQVSGG